VIPDDALVIGLGGNVGDVRERFVRAREALAQLGDVRSAPLYRTAAIGPAQPAFLNSAVRVRFPDATAPELIHTVLELERLLGRDRKPRLRRGAQQRESVAEFDRRAEPRWGPRTIDLDVLVWGTRVIRSPDLDVPHPRIAERRFALRPLIELFGEDTVLPGTSDTLGALEQRVATQAIEELATAW
jgi:2-amino-4-hydroxy-6-hydroxymethyldihydropteridine diphosphokinase